MAPVLLKFVVSFSSQDDVHKVQNLISGNGCKKWLSCSKEKSGHLEAIFQLEEFTYLAYIDIGTIWCSTVEIQVGRSDWPQNKPYITLTPTASLMTPLDCRTSKNSMKSRIFSKNDFRDEVASQKWDRLKIILRQPFRKDVQFGLSFINVKSPSTSSKTGLTLLSENNQVHKIKSHFFGPKFNGLDENDDILKEKLLKISSSGENGTGHLLSRTAKLVLAASENTNKTFSPVNRAKENNNTARRGLFSDHVEQKNAPKIENEIVKFLFNQKLTPADLDTVTVADLRHKLERIIKRKLNSEEKKQFMNYCQSYLVEILEGDIRHDVDASPPDISSSPQDVPRKDNSSPPHFPRKHDSCSPSSSHQELPSTEDMLDQLLMDKKSSSNSVSSSDNINKEHNISDSEDSTNEILRKNNKLLESCGGVASRHTNTVRSSPGCLKAQIKNSVNNVSLSKKKTLLSEELENRLKLPALSKTGSPSGFKDNLTIFTPPRGPTTSVFSGSKTLSGKKRKKNVYSDDNDICVIEDSNISSSASKRGRGQGRGKGRGREASSTDSSILTNDIWLTAGIGQTLGSLPVNSPTKSSAASSYCDTTTNNDNIIECSVCKVKIKDYLMDHHLIQCSTSVRLTMIDIPPLPPLGLPAAATTAKKTPKSKTFRNISKKNASVSATNTISNEVIITSYKEVNNNTNDEVVIPVDDDDDVFVSCPVCTVMLPADMINIHTNACLDSVL